MSEPHMKIEVEISQSRSVGNNLWVPALVGMIISIPTGDVGPPRSQHTAEVMRPEVGIYVDLTAMGARDLAAALIRHASLIDAAEVKSL